jgi:septal ring factor EnvC (AmiA/AmiB activator)
MENANKSALSSLQQEQARKDEEIKQLKEESAKLRAELNRNTGNDLNYNSFYGNNDHTENNDINYDVVPGTLKRKMN